MRGVTDWTSLRSASYAWLRPLPSRITDWTSLRYELRPAQQRQSLPLHTIVGIPAERELIRNPSRNVTDDTEIIPPA